jgi:hypothetical protein
VADKNYLWLKQYLTDEDIEQFFEYSPCNKRHYYFHNKGEESQYVESRSVDPLMYGSSKSISYGEKPYHLFGKWKETGIVIFVEDIVSAIKLHHKYGVVCLHGSFIPWIKIKDVIAHEEVKQVIFWLDCDKSWQSMNYSKLASNFKPCAVIRTEKDPKALSYPDIEEQVEGVLDAIRD